MGADMATDKQHTIEKYRRHATTYDRRTARGNAIRRKAIARLNLRPADVVLDVACGTGINFSLIEQAIGKDGHLIGIEVSSDMLGKAQKLIDTHGWQNVTLIQSSAEHAKIPCKADAVLFSFAHDVLQSPRALENVFRHVKAEGRVAATGTKWAPWWAIPFNLYIWYIVRQYVTTFEGYRNPWAKLARFGPDLQLEASGLGAYVAWGATPSGGA